MKSPERIRLVVLEAWQDFVAAFLCRHRRLSVYEPGGFVLCRRCARLWRVKDRGKFTQVWESKRLTAENVEAFIRHTAGRP